MSFRVALRTAPRRNGIVGSASAFSGASTITVASLGLYTGTANKTYTFTMGGAVTWHPASHKVTWSDGTNTGAFQIGSAYYTEAASVLVAEGVLLQFSGTEGASIIAAADTFTVAVMARNSHGLAFQEIAGDASPSSVMIDSAGPVATDFFESTWDGRQRIVQRAELSRVRGMVDYLDGTNLKRAQLIKSRRQQITVGEDYSEDTVFLWRASRGLLPLIGKSITFARTGIGSYQDAETGFWKIAATGVARYGEGKADRGIIVGNGATNVLTFSHAQSGATGWASHAGAPTISFDTTVTPLLDPQDTGWLAGYRAGVAKIEMATADAVRDSVAATISASSSYVMQVNIRGRGKVTVGFYMGAADPAGTLKTSQQVTLDGTGWQKITLQSASAVGEVRANIRITADEASVVWVDWKQIEQGAVGSEYIETFAGAASRNAETVTFPLMIPETGGFAFWGWLPAGTPVGDYYIFETTTGGRWSIRYDATADELEFWTTNASPLIGAQVIAGETWTHIAVTWKRSGTAGSVDRVIYVNGAPLVSDTSSSWAKNWGGTLQIDKTGGTSIHGWRFEEIRCDSVAWSAAEVTDIYNRFVRDDWLYLHRLAGGRYYRIEALDYSWLHPAVTDICIATVAFGESDREDDSLVTAS